MVQSTPESAPAVGPGLALDCLVHVVPLSCSTSVDTPSRPTAVHEVAAVQSTPDNAASAPVDVPDCRFQTPL